MVFPDINDLYTAIVTFLQMPLAQWFGLGELGPSLIQLLGGAFWLAMAAFSWWFVGRRSSNADQEDAPIAWRLTALGLRLLATALCVLLAVDIVQLVPATQLIASVQKVLDAKLFEVGGTQVTVTGIAILIVVVALTFWGSSVLSNLTIKALSDRGVDTTGTVGVLLNLGRYVVIIVGLAVALTTAGIDLTALFTVGAVFAVTIGFALQNITQNFVSGVILLVEGAITPGDVLEVEGRVVRVVRMGMRSTVVRSMDDEDLIVPNGVLAQGTVKNLTMVDDTLRVRATVGVAYETDLDEVKAILEKAALQVTERDYRRPPVVLLQEFADSGIIFDTFVWIEDPWVAPKARSELRLAIWRAFRKEQVSIPFPQVDLHVKEPIRLVEPPEPRPVAAAPKKR